MPKSILVVEDEQAAVFQVRSRHAPAALAADGDIAALGVKDGFGQRQPDADAVLAGILTAIETAEYVR